MGPYGPHFMAYCVVPVPIWSWVLRCAILGNLWAKEMLIYDYCSKYSIFALKSRFLRCLTPPPPVALSTPMVPIWTDTPKIMYSHSN